MRGHGENFWKREDEKAKENVCGDPEREYAHKERQ